MFAPQLEAYQNVQKSKVMSGREIEAAALTRCALMLAACRNNWHAMGRDKHLQEALRNDQIVWSILQSELVRDDNPLPIEIRNSILTLSVFIDKRILEMMAHPDPEKLKILVDINLNLAAGLRGSPSD